MEKAQGHTIREKLLKIGAQVRVTVRKVWVWLAQSCPYAGVFAQVWEKLRTLPRWETGPPVCPARG